MINPQRFSILLAFSLVQATSTLLFAKGEAAKPEALDTLPNFKVELVRTADAATEGSWISIAKDPKGRLLLGAEKKEPISRLTIKDGQVVQAEILKIPLGEVMGMLFAFDSLYINGRGNAPDGHEVFGLWRCRSTHGDDAYDQVELLREWKGGGGDHGAHAILLNPDKKHLNIVCGNFVDVPEDVLPTSPHRNYADDLVLPRAEDGNGFGAGRKPPGGFVVRLDPDGSHCELVASGERNTYCVAYNHDGELFGFDSDMEWDWGTPWYRPVRVFHAISGADHGFREGASKWPEYYQDSLPATVTIGIGCPTGVVFGDGAKFPAKYQRAFYIEDWTYGRLIAVHLTPDGASYGGTWENFVAPKSLHDAGGKTPLNMTGVLVGEDGAMYFTTGGRHTQGALFRVTYTGTEPTTPADLHDTKGSDARAVRHDLEAFHGHEDAKAVDLAWPQLASTDRFLRYTARIAIESQPITQWKARALAETNPAAALTALLSVARLGGTESQADLFKALAKFPLSQIKSEAQQLEKLRVIEVSLSRQGRPATDLTAPLIAELSPLYPANTVALNRELCQILLALDAPDTIARTLKLLAAAPTQEEQLNYIVALRTIATGWTPELRRQYFTWWTVKRNATQHPDYTQRWFAEAGREYSDGASFNNFLVKVRRTAVGTVPPAELAGVQSTLDLWAEPLPKLRTSKKQRAFVQDWKMADLEADLDQVGHGRNFAQGQDAVFAVQCLMCHRVGDEGGSVGPELTAISSRFSRRDLLESILEPSKVISEQYANTDIVLKNGTPVSGRIVSETADKIIIRPTMLAPDMQEINKADIQSREVSKVSPMPPSLLSMLTKQEILDLLAYFEAAGHPDGAPFKK
ncbi:MAG: heme-binding protein [Chthoniobacter sp.]|uniref:heme-binding protein n=1 Tax=Chthoniobacter sp. TaxID=2510640 RepID=UPI0032ADEAAF